MYMKVHEVLAHGRRDYSPAMTKAGLRGEYRERAFQVAWVFAPKPDPLTG